LSEKRGMAASHPSLDPSEPKGSGPLERAFETERPAPPPPSITSAASDARLQAALSATSRADASLSTLMRAVRELTTGVATAREANLALVTELGALADLLGAANERQLALKNRGLFLEQALVKAGDEAKREREYLIDQQDAFIVALLEDHERAVAELRRELDVARERSSQRPTASSLSDLAPVSAPISAGPATEPAPAPDVRLELEAAKKDVERLLAERERTRETLLKLQAQRDEAQASVVKLTRERELVRAEGVHHRIGDAVRQAIPVHTPMPTPTGRMATTQPPPESPRPAGLAGTPASNRNPRATEPAPFNEKSSRQTDPMPVGIARTRSPSIDPLPREPRIPSPPPEELRAAIHAPETPLPPAPVMTPVPVTPHGPEAKLDAPLVPSGPPSNQKHDPSIRPTGGYSMTNSVAPERVNTSAVSRPPRR
jgi:hypothetical protein